MTLRVIVPPDPILTPNDIDGATQGMISAVVGEIDGPDGWLGRAIGPQTIELSLDCWGLRHMRLPLAPIIELVAVKYTDTDGVEHTVDPSNYGKTGDFIWFKPSWHPPRLGDYPEPVRIQYRAGYDGETIESGGTGEIPSKVLQAVTLSVQYLKAIGKDDLFLQVDLVEGVGRRQYVVSTQAGEIIQNACDRLLAGLRLYA